MEDKYLTVTALTRYLKHKFDIDSNLRQVYLKGEISNFKAHSTGHYYFSIKDENSIIKAIMFNNKTKKLAFVPNEGMKVLVTGIVSIYETGGTYQIYVDDMVEDGVGNLHIAFLKLKEKLQKEGLFQEEHKKKIPSVPTKVGIVTASTGAAIKDILSTIKRRYPICETYLFPCIVQGEGASIDIIKKIKQADQYSLDVLIVGRGGGSFEDLNCFNDEELARTVYQANVPIISAVGHEVDYTIIDFVADLRAPTPTGAAEMAVPNFMVFLNQIGQYKIRINEVILKNIRYQKLYIDSIKNSFVVKNPMLMYEQKKQKIDLYQEKLNYILNTQLEQIKYSLDKIKSNHIIQNPAFLYQEKNNQMNLLIEKLELLNPLSILKRGYHLTYKNKQLIKSIKQIKKGDKLMVYMHDGNIMVHVEEIIGGNHEV